MSSNSGQWEFASSFDAKRRLALEAADDLVEIVHELLAEVSRSSFRLDAGMSAGLVNCLRPVFTIPVRPQTYDAFFNGPRGYRAQYFASAEIGQTENNHMLGLLIDHLIRVSARLHTGPALGQFDLKKSLSACSAKVWIDEHDFPFRSPTKDLAIVRWKEEAALGIDKAIWGLCAPTGTQLQVKGAFLDPAGNEVVPSDKVRRRYDIYQYGFS
jgi:hypothetical protein